MRHSKHIIFYNANILTQDSRQPRASALLISGDTIRAVGETADVLAHASADTPLVDLQGLTLIPGFIDAHIHVWKVGNLLTHQLDVRNVRSLDELLEALIAYRRQYPERRWLLARGFNEALWPQVRMPDRHDLDRAVSDRPLTVMRTCAHQLVANTAALEAAGISAATEDPAGGSIGRDSTGQPNGQLIETAMGLILNRLPQPNPEEYCEMIEAAQRRLLENGITAATDPAVMPDVLQVYRHMCQQGLLQVRLQAIPVRLPEGALQPLPLPDLFEHPYLQINTVKFFADGAISGRTAAMYQPYPGTNHRGCLRLQAEQLFHYANEAQQAGFRIATHAIGDAAMDLVCHTYEQLWQQYRRPYNRIEHVGLPSTDNLHFMHEAHVCAVMQPIFIYELGRNFRLYLDDERRNRLYPLRSVRDAGVRLALSTDAPVVSSLNPFDNLRAAVFRRDAEGYYIGPDQGLTPAEALEAYTMGSAWANQTASFNGSLSAGKWADFVVLNDNPLLLKDSLMVVATFVGGTLRYLTPHPQYHGWLREFEGK
ncbi:MAG: amidohydrolase [Chitinophagales bacterium]|nr:amidohydrolase [Chitinophagales bacterium]MDW8428633.1 amidohydrolase [Chitinophagales bacterium]